MPNLPVGQKCNHNEKQVYQNFKAEIGNGFGPVVFPFHDILEWATCYGIPLWNFLKNYNPNGIVRHQKKTEKGGDSSFRFY